MTFNGNRETRRHDNDVSVALLEVIILFSESICHCSLCCSNTGEATGGPRAAMNLGLRLSRAASPKAVHQNVGNMLSLKLSRY